MKKNNFNIKNRKNLSLILCLVLVSVFTLTIAYSALNTVLTISGNARVSAADWDIYLSNPRVTNGSATTDVPEIKTSSTLEFSTTLNMPGDFYEFTVDVVNGGNIDAMIDNVVKNPELTTDQAKYLKYEITYQNGVSITQKQTLTHGTSMPIKVRIEYRKDLLASGLPTGQVVLDLSLTLEYVQSDGTGITVNNNGVGGSLVSANGDIDTVGTIVTIGSEQFYVIGTEGDNVKLLSMYNLYIGNSAYEDGVPVSNSTENQSESLTGSTIISLANLTRVQSKIVKLQRHVGPLESPTGKQSELARGYVDGATKWYGTIEFSSDTQKGTNYSDYSGSIVEGYVNNYKTILESDYGVDVAEARLITKEELMDSETFSCVENDYCSDKYSWIYSTAYWTGSAYDAYRLWFVYSDGYFNKGYYYNYDDDHNFGVRPVIVISKDYFN